MGINKTPRTKGRIAVYRRHPSEHQEQCAFVKLARLHLNLRKIDPRLLFAIPNAGAGAQRGQAGKMKAEGVVPGIPDLFLAYPTASYPGLFIEMKSAIGRASKEQIDMHSLLIAHGYAVSIAYSCQEAINIMLEYIDGKRESLSSTQQKRS